MNDLAERRQSFIEGSWAYAAQFEDANSHISGYYSGLRELRGALFDEEVGGDYPDALGDTAIKSVLSEAMHNPYAIPRLTEEVGALREVIALTNLHGTLTLTEMLRIRENEKAYLASPEATGVEVGDALQPDDAPDDISEADAIEPVIESTVKAEPLPEDLVRSVSRAARKTRGIRKTLRMALRIDPVETMDQAAARIASVTQDVDKVASSRVNGGTLRPQTNLGRKVANKRKVSEEGVREIVKISKSGTIYVEL